MKIKLPEMTLKQIASIERFIYVQSEYLTEEFTDIEFTDFIQSQFEFGLDDIEFDLQDEVLYYHVDSPSDAIYYFEDKIRSAIDARKEAEMIDRAFEIVGGVF